MIPFHILNLSKQRIAFLFATFGSIIIGLGLPYIVTNGSNYTETRIAYGGLTFIGAILVGIEVSQLGWIGLVTPLSMTMGGFFYFFFLTPLVNPSLIQSLYLNPERFGPLVSMIALGITSFVIGYFFSHRTQLNINWLDSTISSSRLLVSVLAIIGIYTFIGIFMSLRGGFSPLAFILQSQYISSKNNIFSVQFEGITYYLLQIFRWLPISIAAPGMYCILDKSIPLRLRAVVILGLVVMILVALGQGIRYILAYILGSIMVLFYIKSLQFGKRTGIVQIRAIIILMLMFVAALIQFQTRSSVGLYSVLTGENPLNIYQGIYSMASEIAADQNYTLEGVLKAERFGSLKYSKGESYLLNFVMFIPRKLWPGKPGSSLSLNLQYANPFYSENVSYSIIGELIYNFSRYSVFPGMALWGYLSGLWWNIFRKYKESPLMLILYAMSAIPFAFMVRGSFATMFGGIMYPMVVTIVLLNISKRKMEDK